MTALIEKAAKGRRRAMMLLYARTKQKVWYVSFLLLCDEEAATEVAESAYCGIWDELISHNIRDEAAFAHLLLRRAANAVKKRLARQNPKLFRIPRERNFLIVAERIPSSGTGTPSPAEVLRQLPPLQRLALVLHRVGGFLPEQIGSALKCDLRAAEAALAAEEPNLARLLPDTGDGLFSPDRLIRDLCNGEADAAVPASLDSAVLAVIDGIASPLERKRKRLLLLAGAAVLAVCLLATGIFALVRWIRAGDGDGGEGTTAGDDSLYSPAALDASLAYYADIGIAGYGTVTVLLDQASAPITAANFVALAEDGFYDGLTFHRIMEGFMMQGGDPNGDGTGGSGYTIVGEFPNNGHDNFLSHTRGAISMARLGSDYDSATSQFFIVQEDCSSSLDGDYAVFGYVTEGMEIVDAICAAAEPTDTNGTIPAEEQPIITSVTIRTE